MKKMFLVTFAFLILSSCSSLSNSPNEHSRNTMDIHIRENEVVLLSGAANHFVGFESVGGKLFLTNERLYFTSHNFNIQTHEFSLEISDIANYGKRNTMGIFPNGIFISAKQGENENFVLGKRSEWLTQLDQFDIK